MKKYFLPFLSPIGVINPLFTIFEKIFFTVESFRPVSSQASLLEMLPFSRKQLRMISSRLSVYIGILSASIDAVSLLLISISGISILKMSSSISSGSLFEYSLVYLQRLRTPEPSSSARPILLKKFAIIGFYIYVNILIKKRRDLF